MAKAPSKRRGITLGSRADSVTALDLLYRPPAPSATPAADPTRPDPEAAGQSGAAAEMSGQVDELRRLNADLENRWRKQVDDIERQLQQLDQQRDQIARQSRELLALEQRRAASGRVGALLALLAFAGVAALGVHGWPWLRGVAEDFDRMSAGVAELAPQLQAVRGQVTALGSDEGQMDGAMASLREDVAGVRSDLSSLRRAVDTLSEGKGAAPTNVADRRGSATTWPYNATTMTSPYRTGRPMMPW